MMIFGKSHSERFSHGWWFAWYPVMLGSGRWTWLERVRREYEHGEGGPGVWLYYQHQPNRL